MSSKVEWNGPMVDALHELRGLGHPLLVCAEEIGVSYNTVCVKAQEEGVARRMNRGNIPGVIVTQETNHGHRTNHAGSRRGTQALSGVSRAQAVF